MCVCAMRQPALRRVKHIRDPHSASVVLARTRMAALTIPGHSSARSVHAVLVCLISHPAEELLPIHALRVPSYGLAITVFRITCISALNLVASASLWSRVETWDVRWHAQAHSAKVKSQSRTRASHACNTAPAMIAHPTDVCGTVNRDACRVARQTKGVCTLPNPAMLAQQQCVHNNYFAMIVRDRVASGIILTAIRIVVLNARVPIVFVLTHRGNFKAQL